MPHGDVTPAITPPRGADRAHPGTAWRRVFPTLDHTRLLKLFHKGVAGQWSSDAIDWQTPLQLAPAEQQALAQVLTPVYFGEHTAILGASAMMPQVVAAHHTDAQLYLATLVLDEARHFETLTRFYHTMGQRPLEGRALKAMLRYQARLCKSRDTVEWLWGLLMSDILAQHFYGMLIAVHPTSLLATIARRIVRDEARHLAFAEWYLQDLLTRQPERAPQCLRMRDELLGLMQVMHVALKPQAQFLGLDGTALFAAVAHDIEYKVQRLRLQDDAPCAAGPGEEPRVLG